MQHTIDSIATQSLADFLILTSYEIYEIYPFPFKQYRVDNYSINSDPHDHRDHRWINLGWMRFDCMRYPGLQVFESIETGGGDRVQCEWPHGGL